jgi:hypothetical protein
MSFKTQKEIWEALISQKKITHKEWRDLFLQMDAGFIVDVDGDRYHDYFDHPSDWSLYEEPKKMKTVTLYRYTYQELGRVFQTPWRSMPFDSNLKLLKTESKTLEVEDV